MLFKDVDPTHWDIANEQEEEEAYNPEDEFNIDALTNMIVIVCFKNS